MAKYEESVHLAVPPDKVFAIIDDYVKLSGHMNSPSLMMGGGRMKTEMDEGHGQKVGSHIKLTGRAFGINIYLDEVITSYEPPYRKTWETVGEPKLLIIGSYKMGFEIMPMDDGSHLKVFIEYNPPKKFSFLEKLFGRLYAKWCVRQMLTSVQQ